MSSARYIKGYYDSMQLRRFAAEIDERDRKEKDMTFRCQFCFHTLPVSEKSGAKYGDGTITCKRCEFEIDREIKETKHREGENGRKS